MENLEEHFVKNSCPFSEAIKNIAEANHGSKSNGCLMRITPLAVLLHHFSKNHEQIEKYVKYDLELTHSNETCLVATTAYVIAITYLLSHSNDVEGAIAQVAEYIIKKQNKDVIDSWERVINAETDDDLIPAGKHIGYIMIAFEYSFFYLNKKYDYQDAIKAILLKGGDTDTNACIVGGLIGASLGFTSIHETWRNSVLDASSDRPDWLQPKSEKHFRSLIDQILDKSVLLHDTYLANLS